PVFEDDAARCVRARCVRTRCVRTTGVPPCVVHGIVRSVVRSIVRSVVQDLAQSFVLQYQEVSGVHGHLLRPACITRPTGPTGPAELDASTGWAPSADPHSSHAVPLTSPAGGSAHVAPLAVPLTSPAGGSAPRTRAGTAPARARWPRPSARAQSPPMTAGSCRSRAPSDRSKTLSGGAPPAGWARGWPTAGCGCTGARGFRTALRFPPAPPAGRGG